MDSVTVTHGASYTLPACKFTPPAGKTFDKWDLGKAGASVTITKATTIKAIWKDKAPAVLKGDYDRNGVVNVRDHAYLARALKGQSGYTKPENMDKAWADLNGDGKVNRLDRIWLSRALKGMSGYTLT